MITLTPQERLVSNAMKKVKDNAGSHSPSIFTLVNQFPNVKIKVDACFLSNPYASKLFFEFFQEDFKNKTNFENLIQYYPSQNAMIAQLVAKHLDISAQTIFMGNGAVEVIQAVIHNFVKQKMIVNIPTFSSYYELAEDNVEVIYNQLSKTNNFNLDIENYLKLVKNEKPDTVVLINPNNPDGSYIKFTEIEYLIKQLKNVDNIIIDESFIHFAREEDDQIKSTVKLIENLNNLIIIKSMSKDFGIAGIRAGYGVMNAEKVNHLLKNGYLWNLSGLAEYFFRIYIQDDFQKMYEKARIKYIYKTKILINKLSQIDVIKAYPSQANFVLIELLEGSTAFDCFNKLLLKHGVYTRNCSDKIGLPGEFIRIASRTKKENKKIIKNLISLFLDSKDTTKVSKRYPIPMCS
ncbi:MAG: histidinol-phosphate aminotransferase family protein [Moorea sp. SIO2I5]|nr:histidinol-phosphate aminotransferase family protein [Moorena sp. SIO2I5]